MPPVDAVLDDVLVGWVAPSRNQGTVPPDVDAVALDEPARNQGTVPPEAVVLAPASTGAALALLICDRGATGESGSLLHAVTSMGTTTAAASTGIRTTRATIEAGITIS